MSYATIEFADKYFKSQYGSSWEKIEPEVKQQLLDNATLNIEFPRRFIDLSVSDDRRVAAACCEEAISIFENDGINTQVGTDFIDFKLGDISISGASDKNDNKLLLFGGKAEKLLKPYLKSGSFKVVL